VTAFVLFGVGSAIIVEFAETCRRLGHSIAAGVANRETRRYLDASVAVIAPDQLTPALIGLPCLCPLFTPANRFVAVGEAERLGLGFPTALIDPTAIVAADLIAGGGSFVNAGAIVGASVTLGEHVVVNRGASIGHHGWIEAFASLGPGVILAGEVFVGRGAMIGAGAVILPGVRIGEHAIVGAGAVVTADAPPYTKVLGVSGRPVEGRTRGFPEAP
jgi:sugar O-acyltransferase (sialic acid O-acetyltransferase NeuD family)